jgi:membrane-associated protein
MPVLEHWRYLGAFLGILAEEAGVPLPVPGDVFIIALGAAGSQGHASFLMTTVVVVTSAVLGSAILFEISRRLGEPLLRRVGHRFGFDGERALRVERWLNSHGAVTIALWRLVPGFRIVLTVAAGALRMNRASFLLGVAGAAVLWSALYYWLGYTLGASVATTLKTAAVRAFGDVSVATEVVIAIGLTLAAVAGMILWRRLRARRNRTG